MTIIEQVPRKSILPPRLEIEFPPQWPEKHCWLKDIATQVIKDHGLETIEPRSITLYPGGSLSFSFSDRDDPNTTYELLITPIQETTWEKRVFQSSPKPLHQINCDQLEIKLQKTEAVDQPTIGYVALQAETKVGAKLLRIKVSDGGLETTALTRRQLPQPRPEKWAQTDPFVILDIDQPRLNETVRWLNPAHPLENCGSTPNGFPANEHLSGE